MPIEPNYTSRQFYRGQMEVVVCPNCGAEHDGFTGMNDHEKPRPGDYVVCSDCSKVNKIADDGALVPGDDWREVLDHEERFAMEGMIQIVTIRREKR